MGTGVFGGMLATTFVATIFIPLFFRLLSRGKQHMPAGDRTGNGTQGGQHG